MDLRTAVIAAAFANEARRVQASGTEFWNAAAADAAYRDAVKLADEFEAAMVRAKESGDASE